MADALAGRPGGEEALAAEIGRREPDVWTSHGRLALLAHAVAYLGRADLAPPPLAAMAPVRHCLATFGQVGALGPVALAVARLADLLGDRPAAEKHLIEALRVARDSEGAGSLVHCRLLAARWASERGPTPDLRQELVALARAADARGMSGALLS